METSGLHILYTQNNAKGTHEVILIGKLIQI